MPDRDARPPHGALSPESGNRERSRQPDGPDSARPGFNRRDFIKGSGAALAASAAATAVIDEAEAAEQAAAGFVPAKAVDIKLNVNGQEHTLKLEPRVTLLDALRHDLNLTGAKPVCDTTNCGACTVIVDGKPVFACARLAVECQGKKVTTVEGLTSGKNVDQVVAAFIKHDASQCGYCTPGFVVAVKAFLEANPKANLEQVLKGLGGNLCRCGTYVGVTAAALECAGHGKEG
jgi:xanthine dehydrogenase YagT iron-sulfur-binding subunit